MLFAILILVGAGIYVLVRGEVQASSKLVIRGKAAQRIGIALILGGIFAFALPFLAYTTHLIKQDEFGIILGLLPPAASLGIVGVIMLSEKRKIGKQ